MNARDLRVTVGEKIGTLQRCVVFRDLSLSETIELASHAIPGFHQRGKLIFGEGDPADFIYIVHDGLVRVQKTSPRSGKKFAFAILAEGEIIASPAPSEQRYSMSSEAITDVAVLRIAKEEFVDYVTTRPKAAAGLITLLTERLERECERNMDILSEKVEIRLIRCLFLLGSKFGNKLCLTRKELGSYAGTTTETTIRVLSQLRKKGLVGRSESLGEIVIADLAVLQQKLQ